MPLVDYDVSDESDHESDDESEVQPSVLEKKEPAAAPPAEINGLETEPEGALFSALPKPKPQQNENSLKSILLNKSLNSAKPKEAVKITIPSLSEFTEEDEPKPAPKKFKTSSTSALFSVLPPPKNQTVKEAKRTLIPDSVMKRSQTQVQPNPSVKPVKPVKAKVNPVVVEPVEDDDKIDHGPSLMFSHDFLNSGNSNSNDSDSTPVVVNKIETEQFDIPDLQQTDWERGDIHVTQFDIIDNPSVHSVDQIPLPPPQELELDDKALEVLMGKKRKREQVPLEIIDISGKDIMPDSREWLLKQFQEDQPKAPPSAKAGNFSANSKRKHQITYLAYQAKAQELELQNQWAQNRMTRKQTQQKYGF